jgi:hypothetical protein
LNESLNFGCYISSAMQLSRYKRLLSQDARGSEACSLKTE